MRKRAVTVALGCFVAIAAAASCAQTPQTPQPTGRCPPLLDLAAFRPIGCHVYPNHFLAVGNPTATTIPKGTAVSFAAKLLNGDAYCTTVPAPEPIPPHLFVVITGLYGPPLFDDQAPCQAWREATPEVKP